MIGTTTLFENRTKSTIWNPDMAGFQILAVLAHNYIIPLSHQGWIRRIFLLKNCQVLFGNKSIKGEVKIEDRTLSAKTESRWV